MAIMLTMEELGEELCGYCDITPCNSAGYWCEGACCDEAYSFYLDSIGLNEDVVRALERTKVVIE